MAKSIKLEDYWKQHNIEGVFKDLTHMLVQKMSADPVLAIVQHLQKKYPKSFKYFPDLNETVTSATKTAANNLRSQSILSAASDTDLANRNEMNFPRRESTQSQVSGIVTIPSMGSAFTGLLKFDRSESQAHPESILRNIAMVDRLSQRVVRMGKDLRSDHDILEEELIHPIRTKEETPHLPDQLLPSKLEDPDQAPTHEHPTTLQLIKYKQNIRTQHDRFSHRQQLASLAAQKRAEEEVVQVSGPETLEEGSKRMRRSRGQHQTTHAESDEAKAQRQKKPVLGVEEEELLKEELNFDAGLRREKERGKGRSSTSRSRSPYVYAPDLVNSARVVPMMQFMICRVCGNVMNSLDTADHPLRETPKQQFESVTASEAAVDDWFESGSSVGGSRQTPIIIPDPVTPSPSKATPDPTNFFEPIDGKTNSTTVVEPRVVPLIITDDDSRTRNRTPRLSGSDIFVRTPEPPASRRSSIRNVPSPPVAFQRTGSATGPTPPADRNVFSPNFFDERRNSPVVNRSDLTTNRRTSGWGAEEQSSDNSD